MSLSAFQTRPLFDRLIDIYQAAFSQPPYLETLPDFFNFAGRLSFHSRQPGFRCVIAAPAQNETPVGFAYGCAGNADTWFYRQVASHLSEEIKRRYMSDYFEFAELAVLPRWQGQGVGGQLHDALLLNLDQQAACLATADMETPARRLYRHRGWITLLEGITLPNVNMRFAALGKLLTG